jgi:hypothetical protein
MRRHPPHCMMSVEPREILLCFLNSDNVIHGRLICIRYNITISLSQFSSYW